MAYTLDGTQEKMLSDDYKERFVAEVIQNKARLGNLTALLDSYQRGTLPFEPTCSITLLQKQQLIMLELDKVLEERAKIEGIEIPEA